MATQAQIKVERSARIISPKARASYPTLFVPRAFNETTEPKFSITLMVPKNAVGQAFVDQIERAQADAVKAIWGNKPPKNLEVWGVTDGDEDKDASMAGFWLVKASNKIRPAVVDLDRQQILDESEVYGGCYVRASICAKSYGTSSKGGVTLELVAVQKLEDGEPFGGAEKAKAQAVDEFADADM